MINNKFKLGPELIFTITIVLFFVLMLVVENINGRFQTNDFRVMYDAADSFVHGKAVYGVPFGLSTGYYKYSPFTLLLFVPYTIFSFKTASILHFFIIALSAIASIILIERIISKLFFKNNNQRLLMYFLIFISVALHIIKDIHLGNTNTILIFFLILSLYLTLNNRLILSALFLTLAIFTKPYFAISILPFLLYKKYKTILFSIIFGITFLLI